MHFFLINRFVGLLFVGLILWINETVSSEKIFFRRRIRRVIRCYHKFQEINIGTKGNNNCTFLLSSILLKFLLPTDRILNPFQYRKLSNKLALNLKHILIFMFKFMKLILQALSEHIPWQSRIVRFLNRTDAIAF